MEIANLTITEARRALDAGEYTAEELARAHLDAIAARNDDINAYVEVFGDVLEQAREADKQIAEGAATQLTGIPIAVKDNILIKGRRASAGSKILEQYTASYDAGVIAKLRAHGVVFLGRTNMDEFAMGSSTEHSAFGVTKNPRDTKRVPGGSSGGSAAAVSAGLAVAALGSDTGGSVRQPAAFTGVVGLKPTYGAVSRSGLIAMGSSLDQIGTLTRTSEDAGVMFDAIRGHDENDATSLSDAKRDVSHGKPKTIGVPRDMLTEGVDADVIEEFESALETLKEQGYEVQDITLPTCAYALATYYIIMPAEASTNLARFDGVRYGLSIAADDVASTYRATRGAGFGAEVRRRILVGTFVLSSGYVDAYYRRARDVRAQIRADFENAFSSVDIIATPTTPTPAFALGERSDPLSMYAADMFTVPANLAGIPALSLPRGTVTREGSTLPIGIQYLAPHGAEDTLFTVASAGGRE